MNRRAQSGLPLTSLVVLLVLLAGSVAGGYYFFAVASDPYRTLQPLDVGSYLENANSLRGNTYKMDGKVQNLLSWSPGKGRLFSVEVKKSDGSGAELVPIVVPNALNSVNIQKEQNFKIKVEVGANGILTVQELSKS